MPPAQTSTHFYPQSAAMPLHEHGEASIGFVLAGSVREEVRGCEEAGLAGSIVFKPPGVAHSNRFGGAGALMACLRPIPQLRRLLPFGWRWLHGRKAAAFTFRIVPELLAGDRFGCVEEGLGALLGEIDGVAPGPPGLSPPPWLRRIRDRIHADPCFRPSVAGLAAAAGVHPVYLTRRFRQYYGAPISFYARRLRAAFAADRIAAGDSLAGAAHDLGFADQSHLARVFAAEFGTTAGKYRNLLRVCAAG